MQSILVVGFNVRPLARSAKKAGYRVLAVDFWGDHDLSQWTDEQIAILDQQPNQRPDRPKLPTADALLMGVQQILETHGPVQYMIASGGFDDHPEAWRQLHGLGPLKGNTPDKHIQARDRKKTQKLARKHGAAVPMSFQVENNRQYRSAINQLALPILAKPKFGSGGFQTRILQTETEIEHYAQRHTFCPDDPILIQELIRGIDASVSVLGSGTDTVTISVNEQLIGLADLGKSRTKAYCGNIVPLETDQDTKNRIASLSEDISTDLSLVGSNGFDYVIDKEGMLYFMEINPRIQATIEAFELVSSQNLVNLHLNACAGELPKVAPKTQAFCARLIVYAKFQCEIPNLCNIPGIVDIPMPGSVAEKGDPVCTINHIAATRKQALQGAWEISSVIYKHLKPFPRVPKEKQ